MLSMCLSACCRLHPAKVTSRIGQCSACHTAFALRVGRAAVGDPAEEAGGNRVLIGRSKADPTDEGQEIVIPATIRPPVEALLCSPFQVAGAEYCRFFL